ncbi:MAG: C4-dicarboxylate ABC transporter, partial [Rhodospirillales bacterium]
FGFALFALRAVAPKEIKTSEIYWGAIPWVGLQLIMVVVVIFWPQLVTMLLSRGPTIDPSKIEIQIPASDAPDDSPIQIK